PAPSAPPPAYAQPGPPAAAQAPAAAHHPAPGGPDPRTLWPNILETVKNRRRFTWILLSQNAHVAGFDGTTLQIGFVNAGARDNFASSGSEDVLRAALAEQFNVHWKIEAVIDASGGSAAPAPPGGYGSPAPSAGGYGGGSAGAGGYGGGGTGGGYGGSPAQASRPGPSQAPAPSSPGTAAPHQSTPAARPTTPAPPPAPEPPPVSPEDDIPEDDDPDLDESALSGHELIVRELGATVVEEIVNE
ncbi:DNA polymerase III subunit gamma and tau, partial [Streptomyces sp. ID01-12c]|nr:DNA polymerase III subunit gamma and tau [Streptomyces caniscabiei]